ncbi:MAG: hypothetical protein IKH37_08835 [Prevotella sp.]|nr:hypothetical protein [Prevotella sp.]
MLTPPLYNTDPTPCPSPTMGGEYEGTPTMGGVFVFPMMGREFVFPTMGGEFVFPTMGGEYEGAPTMGGEYEGTPTMGGKFKSLPSGRLEGVAPWPFSTLLYLNSRGVNSER